MAKKRLLECLKLKHVPALLLLEKYDAEYDVIRIDTSCKEFVEGIHIPLSLSFQ